MTEFGMISKLGIFADLKTGESYYSSTFLANLLDVTEVEILSKVYGLIVMEEPTAKHVYLIHYQNAADLIEVLRNPLLLYAFQEIGHRGVYNRSLDPRSYLKEDLLNMLRSKINDT